MAKQKILINNFKGMVSAIDPTLVGLQGQTNIENYQVDAGQLKPVEGTSKINTNIGVTSAILGFNYIRGFNTSNTLTENMLVFSRNASSIRATLVSVGGTSPSFSTSNISFSTAPTFNSNDWQSIVYDNKIIATNTTNVYQADVGLSTFYPASGYDPIVGFPVSSPIANYSSSSLITAGWAGFNTSVATGAFGSLLWKISYKTGVATENLIKDCIIPFNGGSDAGPYAYYLKAEPKTIRFGDRIYNTILPNVAASKGNFTITLFKDDFTPPDNASLQNLQFRDRMYFRFLVKESYDTNWLNNTAKTTFDLSKFLVTLTDSNGKTVQPAVKAQQITVNNRDQIVLCAYWDNKDRYTPNVFDYTKVYKIRIDGWVNFAQQNILSPTKGNQGQASYFDFAPCSLGGVDLTLQAPERNNQKYINFGMVRYTPSNGLLSEIHATSTLTSNDLIEGTFLDNQFNQLPKTGSWLDVSYPISGSNTTESWLVVNDNQSPSAWRKVGFTTNTGAAGVGTAVYNFNVNDLLSKLIVIPNNTNIANVVCMATFAGAVVYGINAAKDNIKYSRVADPLILEGPNDDPNDKTMGGNYTLSESYSDYPIAMASILDTLVIFGYEGVYAQTGTVPSQMGPCRKVPNIPGIAGRFAYVKYNDPILGQGIIYVTRTGDMAIFLYVDARNQNIQYRTIEMSEAIRDQFKSYLTQTNSDISDVKCAYRADIDSIVIANGREAWIWQRPNILDGKRPVVKRRLSDPAMQFNFLSFPVNASGTLLPLIGLSGIGTTQCIAKFDPATYKDHNTDIPSTVVSGTLLTTQMTRIKEMFVDKLTNTSYVGVAITSTRQTASYGIATDLSNTPVHWKQQGFKHQIGLSQTNSVESGIDSYWVTITAPGADRPYSSNI